jgi:mannose/cellobiose epimerase-like protein (N-acyl-D-glucosamine 2-epimerase family)
MGAPVHALQTARMTFVFSMAHLLGVPDADDLAVHGVEALRGILHDDAHGGTLTDPERPDAPKDAYLAAFAALAAAGATQARLPGGAELLDRVADDLVTWFWDEGDGALVDERDRAFRRTSDYRGANANMHAVEAFLSVGAATGDRVWSERALRVADLLIDDVARRHDWMLPEHFDAQWRPRLDYHRDRPDDEFKPYGVTIGHLLEWSRLLLELRTVRPAAWLDEAARRLYSTGRRLGWAVDGQPGFVYTVDWNGSPFVRTRPHWVALEAIAAAATQVQAFGEDAAGDDLRLFTEYSERFLRDRVDGSWHHELDERNRPVARMWQGKPDAYHALQALLVPVLPLASCLGSRILAGGDLLARPARKDTLTWSLD